ncbi:hypothetical protein PCANC_00588 [Puccinia coronata f. sp. avenae]|uniref:Cyclin N-terminal domain-containing protein n=1 Tax=Puccinia coronata f. sp. avenae TaxID=200324 RepID=A0A2N5W845_9BASI|nr:hypothetical protein PCANC_00588 [Puccinia coronata f. sp. avenae]
MAVSLNKSTLSMSSAGSEDRTSAPAPIPANMLRRHPASLIPRHLHDPVLLGLLKAPVNDDLIEYVAERTLAVVSTSIDPVQLPTPPSTPIKASFRLPMSRTSRQSLSPDSLGKNSLTVPDASNGSPVPSLTTFIKLTASQSNAQAPTLLVTLVYLDRLRRRLKGAKAAKGMQCTYHRLFLACLIAAAKYCNDCCPRNIHWVKWSGLFTLSEVNLMEQELLMLLDYELRVEEDYLLAMTNSVDSEEAPSTPLCSPIVIRLDTRHVVSPDSGSPQNKKIRISEVASNSTSTVIKRAKSWYGNLRASTNF